MYSFNFVNFQFATLSVDVALHFKYSEFILLQLTDVVLLSNISEAITNVQSASQDVSLAQQEKSAQITQANRQLLLAQQNATVIAIQANALATATIQQGIQQESLLRTTWNYRIQAFSYIQQSLNMSGHDFVNVYLKNEAMKKAGKITISA